MKSVKNIIFITGLLGSGVCFGNSWARQAWDWLKGAQSVVPKINVGLGYHTNNINHNGTVKHINVQLPATEADIKLAEYIAWRDLERAKEMNEMTIVQRTFKRIEEQLYGLHKVSFLGVNHFLTKSAVIALIYYYGKQPVKNWYKQTEDTAFGRYILETKYWPKSSVNSDALVNPE